MWGHGTIRNNRTGRASRARQLTQARAMAMLIGVDHCGYLVSDLAWYFNRDMPALSRQVKALRARLEKNQSLLEKAAHIQDQITTRTP
jgi:putative transposase